MRLCWLLLFHAGRYLLITTTRGIFEVGNAGNANGEQNILIPLSFDQQDIYNIIIDYDYRYVAVDLIIASMDNLLATQVLVHNNLLL